MAAYIGSHKIDKCYLGTQEIDKVMLGEHEVCSSASALLPLPADSADFIRDPADYVRDGVSRKAVSAHPDRIFPDGPRPFIATHNARKERYQGMADHGFTVVGSTYAVFDTLTEVHEAARLGMKMVFPFRDYSLPLDQSNHGNFGTLGQIGADLQGGNHTSFNAHKLTFDAVSNLVNGDAVANDTVIAWSSKCDDALSLPTYSGFPVTAYHTYARGMFPYFIQKDPRNRGCVDLPQKGYAYRNFADVDYSGGNDLGGWQVSQTIWSAQIYWQDGIDISKGATKSFSSRASHVQTIDRMNQLSAHVGLPPNGKVRRIIPLLWVQGNIQSGTSGYTDQQQLNWKHKTRTCDILAMMMAGAHGFNYFGWNPEMATADWPHGWFGFSYQDEANLMGIVKTLTDAGVIDALLWGDAKTGFSKTPLTDSEWLYGIEKSNELCGPCNPPRNCGGTEAQSCGYRQDMVQWKATQFKGSVYLIATNLMPNPEVIAHWESTGSNFTPIGTSGNANYSIQSRFNLPSIDYEGLECIDILTGNDAAASGEFDAANHRITVTLNHAESRVYKIGPAPGYEGGNVPPLAPVITTHPASVSLHVGDPVHTFHVGYTPPTASVQWEWRHPTTDNIWRGIGGATGDSYTMHDAGTGVTLAQNGDEYRAKVTTSGNPPVYSHTTHITVVT